MIRTAPALVAALLLLSAGCKSKPTTPQPDTSLPQGFRAGAPARYHVPQAKPGWALKLSHETQSGEKSEKSEKAWTHVAVVAETETTLTVEWESSQHEGYVRALEVEKADGKVKRAALAQVGGKSRDLFIRTQDPGAVSEGEEETLKVKAGEFKARKRSGAGAVYWAATGDKIAGAPLKTESPSARQLVRVGSKEPLEVSGRRLDPRVLTYDDKTRLWWTSDKIVQALNGGIARRRAEGAQEFVVSIATNAKPRVEWPSAKAAGSPAKEDEGTKESK